MLEGISECIRSPRVHTLHVQIYVGPPAGKNGARIPFTELGDVVDDRSVPRKETLAIRRNRARDLTYNPS